MVAVATVGQFLHFIVLVIAHAVTQYGQVYTTFAFFLYDLYQFPITADAYVKVSIGSQDDPVVATFDEMFFGGFVGQADAFATCGGAASLEFVDGFLDFGFVVARSGFQHQTSSTCVYHNGYAVLWAQLISQEFEGSLYQGELIGGTHAARYVDQENQIGRG